MLSFVMFIFFSFVFVFSGACFIKIAHISIQPMQWADKIFGWQKMLTRLDQKGSALTDSLYKILGGCEVCFSHFISVLWFIGYVICSRVLLDYWVHDMVHGWAAIIIVNIVWYLCFICTTTISGLYFITKLFEKR